MVKETTEDNLKKKISHKESFLKKQTKANTDIHGALQRTLPEIIKRSHKIHSHCSDLVSSEKSATSFGRRVK